MVPGDPAGRSTAARAETILPNLENQDYEINCRYLNIHTAYNTTTTLSGVTISDKFF